MLKSPGHILLLSMWVVTYVFLLGLRCFLAHALHCFHGVESRCDYVMSQSSVTCQIDIKSDFDNLQRILLVTKWPSGKRHIGAVLPQIKHDSSAENGALRRVQAMASVILMSSPVIAQRLR